MMVRDAATAAEFLRAWREEAPRRAPRMVRIALAGLRQAAAIDASRRRPVDDDLDAAIRVLAEAVE